MGHQALRTSQAHARTPSFSAAADEEYRLTSEEVPRTEQFESFELADEADKVESLVTSTHWSSMGLEERLERRILTVEDGGSTIATMDSLM